MKVALLSLKYVHLPQLHALCRIKNSTLHYVLTHYFRNIDVPRNQTYPLKLLVKKIWGYEKDKCEKFMKNDDFLKKFAIRYYDDSGRRKPDMILMEWKRVLDDKQMMLIASTIHKCKLKILTLNMCDLDDFMFSRIQTMDFSEIVELSLEKNHLTNHSIKAMNRMNFTKEFTTLRVDFNDFDEDALRIIFNSEVFDNLVNLSIYLKPQRKRKEKVPYEDISRLKKLYAIKCDEDAFSYKVDLKTDQYNKFNKK